jgi:hypothetical protein
MVSSAYLYSCFFVASVSADVCATTLVLGSFLQSMIAKLHQSFSPIVQV